MSRWHLHRNEGHRRNVQKARKTKVSVLHPALLTARLFELTSFRLGLGLEPRSGGSWKKGREVRE